MKNEKGFSAVEILIIIIVIGFIGFAGYYAANRNENETQLSIDSSETVELKDELPSDLSNIKSISEIQTQAQEENSDKSIVGVELETDDGKTVYVIHFNDGSVVVYDAFTGAMVEINDDNDDEIEDDELIPAGFVAGVSIQDAINTAKQNRPNSTLEKVELELEDGVVVYSVRFTDESRVDIDAISGEIRRLKDDSGTDVIKINDDSADGSDDDSDNSIDDTKVQASITTVQARSIAKALYDYPIEKVELENEDDGATYKIEFEDGSKVEIDATNGSVIKSDIRNE